MKDDCDCDALGAKLDMSLEILNKVSENVEHNRECLTHNREKLIEQAVTLKNMKDDLVSLDKTIHTGNGHPGLVTRTEVIEREIKDAKDQLHEAHNLAHEARLVAAEAKVAAQDTQTLVDSGSAKEVAIVTSRGKIILQVIAAVTTIAVTALTILYAVN